MPERCGLNAGRGGRVGCPVGGKGGRKRVSEGSMSLWIRPCNLTYIHTYLHKGRAAGWLRPLRRGGAGGVGPARCSHRGGVGPAGCSGCGGVGPWHRQNAGSHAYSTCLKQHTRGLCWLLQLEEVSASTPAISASDLRAATPMIHKRMAERHADQHKFASVKVVGEAARVPWCGERFGLL